MRRQGPAAPDAAGFTFVEVLIAITLLVIGFLGVYASLYATALLRETANETNVAMFKLQTTMEYIFSLPFDKIPVDLPAGAAVNVSPLVDSDPNNNFQLSGEQVVVTYPKGTGADPLEFTITITWTSRMGTDRTEQMASARAR
jgi:prepilin-type N-terminal cleavage/methylation domain-containing protein